ncbi:DUF488 family protein [Acidovorax sp. Be4]|uniref:DUF488 family protein n=1 Tax=Acidovorax bellezanensis TaxID=2976702 RepID=A0ABT2PV36_9BURK|nr:DUF488 family protein [Acidovorax sp. Be4]MCT9813008.1 DUF488 family protein [Acidovorax sp. Be4]
MPLRIVRLGSPRAPDEGTRIGTVRRPPRGVPKSEFASQDWYDVWLPLLSPQPDTMHMAQQAQQLVARDPEAGQKAWQQFLKAFRKELAAPDASRTLDLLAALSQHSALSVGCYCPDEALCHRSQLRAELVARQALIVDET